MDDWCKIGFAFLGVVTESFIISGSINFNLGL